MSSTDGFSEPIELPNIPEGPGVCIIEDEQGRVLQVAMSANIRGRIGTFLDSDNRTCSYGIDIYRAQRQGTRIFARWKLTGDYVKEKRRLVQQLKPLWGARARRR